MVDLKKQPKVGFNKPLGVSLEVQWDGGSADMEDLKKRAMAALKADPGLSSTGAKVNSIALYVKPDEGKCYWTAETTRGPASGDFGI